MDAYLAIKIIHVMSSTILFGTGLGIAFFMFRSRYTEDIAEKFYAVRTTVLADYLFTAPVVVIQPASGAYLIWQGAYDWTDLWLVATYILYLIAGLCWLPVVWIQIQLKQILANAVATNQPLPPRYFALFNVWFKLGWPAFIGLIVVFILMITKPG